MSSFVVSSSAYLCGIFLFHRISLVLTRQNAGYPVVFAFWRIFSEEFLSADIFSGDTALVADIGQAFQPFSGGKRSGISPETVVQDQSVEVISFKESAGTSEKAAASRGRQIKGLGKGEGFL